VLKRIKLQNSSSDNSSAESIIEKLHAEKMPIVTKKETCVSNFFTRIFQKLVCSHQNFSDDEDESEAIMISRQFK